MPAPIPAKIPAAEMRRRSICPLVAVRTHPIILIRMAAIFLGVIFSVKRIAEKIMVKTGDIFKRNALTDTPVSVTEKLYVILYKP